MLKLRKVELVGFKSFCEKTHLTFSGTGLTCIIGPNGCGKSNIVDAISWVLGEQSHKSLRAERMADCIFNGTAKRPPMGLAEVMLTLVDAELAEAARQRVGRARDRGCEFTASLSRRRARQSRTTLSRPDCRRKPAEAARSRAKPRPRPSTTASHSARSAARTKPRPETRPGEVVIGRRLYRSGQSEYLINGRTARLRDIQELFMGIGLGPDSYAIIEQGRIGQVLSSKPSDRRAIIEEAAGITKFKTKKRLAEAKLESSKLNLSRVNDIYVEIEKQLASLKRQASKARRYAELREQMRGLLRQVLASKAARAGSGSRTAGAAARRNRRQRNRQAQSVTQLEAEQERLDRRIDELDAELRQNQNLIGQAALELDRAENRILFNRQRGEQLRGARAADRRRARAGHRPDRATRQRAWRLRMTSSRGFARRRRAWRRLLSGSPSRSAELAGSAQAADARMAELRRPDSATRRRARATAGARRRRPNNPLAHHSGALERLEQSEQQLLEESLYHRERSHVGRDSLADR